MCHGFPFCCWFFHFQSHVFPSAWFRYKHWFREKSANCNTKYNQSASSVCTPFDRNVEHNLITFSNLLFCYRFLLDWLVLMTLTMWLAQMWQRKTSTGHLRNGCITGSRSTHRHKNGPVLKETMTKMKKRMIFISSRNIILTPEKKVALNVNDPRKKNCEFWRLHAQ